MAPSLQTLHRCYSIPNTGHVGFDQSKTRVLGCTLGSIKCASEALTSPWVITQIHLLEKFINHFLPSLMLPSRFLDFRDLVWVSQTLGRILQAYRPSLCSLSQVDLIPFPSPIPVAYQPNKFATTTYVFSIRRCSTGKRLVIKNKT